MKRPRFTLDEQVKHGKHKCRVTDIINLSDPEDIRLQGYRYYVFYAGQTWSVPESALSLK